jgi:diguanylate cyclase (GGDEF)-like protein
MNQTVLAIDDSAEIHELLDARLRSEGLMIHHAWEPEDGMRQARLLRPDLILLDVDMPKVTGFEVCRHLKEDPTTSEIPIIFLTGATETYAKVEGFDLGAVDYVVKPFEAAELRARVRSVLRVKRYHDLLASRANVDGLTGLWNRSYFNQRLEDEVAAARRYGRSVSLLLADVDNFKSLNDKFGHPFGDRVLQALGESMQSTFRATDAPCRYGGEEFAIILTETRLNGAVEAAERLHAAVRALELSMPGERLPVTLSIGASSTELFDSRADRAGDALVAMADRALYAAKRAGKNRTSVPERPAPSNAVVRLAAGA